MKKLIKSFFNKNSKTKIKPKDLAKKINALSTHEYAQLKDVLYNLAQEGYLEKIGKRYSLNKEKTDKLIGTFQISREGTFGFVILKNSNLNDIFIPEKSFSTAFHGDIVEVKLVARQRGKNLEGKIVEVIKRQNEEIIGILTKVKSYYYVKPDSEEIHKDIFVASEDLNGATAGDKVIVGNGLIVNVTVSVSVQPVVVFMIVIVPVYVPATTAPKLGTTIGLDGNVV